MRFIQLLTPVFFLLCLPGAVSAQLVINEFSSGTTKDWVELFNTSTDSADLSQFRLEDANGNGKNKPLEGVIPGGGILSISFSNYLNNSGDVVNLFFSGNTDPIDSIGYGTGTDLCIAQGEQSIGSVTDGSGTIVRFASATRDGSNNGGTPAPCSSPSPTPTATPTPTKKPTATPTPSATPTAAPKSTQTYTPALSATPIPDPSDNDIKRDSSTFRNEEYSDTSVSSDIATRAGQPMVAGVSTQRRRPVEVIVALIIGSAVTACASLAFATRKLSADVVRQIIRRVR